MDKMIFKTLEYEQEIELFLDKIENFTSVRLSKSYANSSTIVGVFLHNKLAGGYMLVTKPQFRSLLFVPDSIKANNKFFNNDIYEMLEVNGVWLSPAIKTPKMQYKFWMKLVLDIFFSKKKYLLLMSNLKNKNIEYLHSLSNPEILYEGSPNLMAGEKSHDLIRVGYTTRWKAVLNIPKYWLELKNRERRAKTFEKQRQFNRSLSVS